MRSLFDVAFPILMLSSSSPFLFFLFSPITALPSRNTVQARDSNKGCQAASFSNKSWTATSLTYSEIGVVAAPHALPRRVATVKFEFANPALAYPVSCNATSADSFTTDQIHQCRTPALTDTTQTSFSFNSISGLMVVNQTWICSDADPVYPTLINAGSHSHFALSCIETVAVNTEWHEPEPYSKVEILCSPRDVTLDRDWMDAEA